LQPGYDSQPSSVKSSLETEAAGIAAEKGALGADHQVSLLELDRFRSCPNHIVYTGQILHELPRRFGIQLEKLNTQLMASYPPNGDAGYF